MEPPSPALNGYFKTFADQIEALKIAYCEALHRLAPQMWSWGGGTVLALYYWQHRRSWDVDLFIHDPQLLAYLSPKWILDEQDTAFAAQYQETAQHIELIVAASSVKVDFILAPLLFPARTTQNTLLDLDFTCTIQSVEEIIARKIQYRRTQNIARDIFDIGVAVSRSPQILKTLYDAHVLSIDNLFEWEQALRTLSRAQYHEDLEQVSPSAEVAQMAADAPEIIRTAINELRKTIVSGR